MLLTFRQASNRWRDNWSAAANPCWAIALGVDEGKPLFLKIYIFTNNLCFSSNNWTCHLLSIWANMALYRLAMEAARFNIAQYLTQPVSAK